MRFAGNEIKREVLFLMFIIVEVMDNYDHFIVTSN